MLEILNDITTLYFGITIMVLLVAAFTRANMFYVEWELRTNWRHKIATYDDLPKEVAEHLLSLSVKSDHHPKIPSRLDHKSRNKDEEHPNVVFMLIQ